MRPLKTLREGWDQRQQEEAKLSSGLTVSEKVSLFFEFYQTFSARVEETEATFGVERRAHLAELQQRLQRLSTWQHNQQAT